MKAAAERVVEEREVAEMAAVRAAGKEVVRVEAKGAEAMEAAVTVAVTEAAKAAAKEVAMVVGARRRRWRW